MLVGLTFEQLQLIYGVSKSLKKLEKQQTQNLQIQASLLGKQVCFVCLCIYVISQPWWLFLNSLLGFVEMLKQALETNWSLLMEGIGLWIPSNVINTQHDDKPQDEPDFGKFVYFKSLIICSAFTFSVLCWLWKLSW